MPKHCDLNYNDLSEYTISPIEGFINTTQVITNKEPHDYLSFSPEDGFQFNRKPFDDVDTSFFNHVVRKEIPKRILDEVDLEDEIEIERCYMETTIMPVTHAKLVRWD